MNREEYSQFSERVKSVPLRENWYIVFPSPDKLKNFDSLACRLVFFVVTDVTAQIRGTDYMNSFEMVDDLKEVADILRSEKILGKAIKLSDFSFSNSLNRRTKKRVISFTFHYVDRVAEAVKILNGSSR